MKIQIFNSNVKLFTFVKLCTVNSVCLFSIYTVLVEKLNTINIVIFYFWTVKKLHNPFFGPIDKLVSRPFFHWRKESEENGT